MDRDGAAPLAMTRLWAKLPATRPSDKFAAFITRWSAAGGSERANYQLFIGELCALLDLPTPDPASDATRDNAYVFERRITSCHGDGG